MDTSLDLFLICNKISCRTIFVISNSIIFVVCKGLPPPSQYVHYYFLAQTICLDAKNILCQYFLWIIAFPKNYLCKIDEKVCTWVKSCSYMAHMGCYLYPVGPNQTTTMIHQISFEYQDSWSYSWKLCICMTSHPLMIHLMEWLRMKTITMTRLTLASLTSLLYCWPSQPGHWLALW